MVEPLPGWGVADTEAKSIALDTTGPRAEREQQRGTPRGTRTPGLVVRNHALYPLSYGRMSAVLLADPAAIKETGS
jgi:hypothetical protein